MNQKTQTKLTKQTTTSSNLNSPQVSDINPRKIKSITYTLNSLPKNIFSKLVVCLCLIGIFACIITSFIFLALGYDASGLLVPSLAALTGELGLLSMKRIFSKQEKIEDILLTEVQKDLQDGCIYNENGEVVKREQVNNVNIEDITINSSREDTDYSYTVTEITSGGNVSFPDKDNENETEGADWTDEDMSG